MTLGDLFRKKSKTEMTAASVQGNKNQNTQEVKMNRVLYICLSVRRFVEGNINLPKICTLICLVHIK